MPFACGALTMVLTSLTLATQATAALHQVWVAFVPVGAIVSGAGAASGFYVGAVLAGRRPGALAVTCMRSSIVPAYAVLCLLQVQGWSGGAAQARASDAWIIQAISLDPAGLHHATVTGLLVYPLATLAGLGFAVGAMAVTSLLAAPVHCDRCRRYLPGPDDPTGAWPACEFEPAIGTRRPAVALLVRRAHPVRGDS